MLPWLCKILNQTFTWEKPRLEQLRLEKRLVFCDEPSTPFGARMDVSKQICSR